MSQKSVSMSVILSCFLIFGSFGAFAAPAPGISPAELELAATQAKRELLLDHYYAARDRELAKTEKASPSLSNNRFDFGVLGLDSNSCLDSCVAQCNGGGGGAACWAACTREGYGSAACAGRCGTSTDGGSEACWAGCTKEGYGSAACAGRCGINTNRGSEACWAGCTKEGYGSSACASRCGTSTSNGSAACWTACTKEGYGSSACKDRCGTN